MSDDCGCKAYELKVRFKKLVPEAVVPEYATSGSAGLDLVSVGSCQIPPGGTAIVSTGLAIAVPPGFEGQIRPRSGLAAKYGVTVLNSPGTLDSDFRGCVKVILVNHGSGVFAVNPGDRIAQMVIAPAYRAKVTEVESLEDTDRGSGGFGSTGR